MEMKIVERIPLIRIKYKNTEKRVLKIYGNRMCAIYSDLKRNIKEEISGQKILVLQIFLHSMNVMKRLRITKMMV